MYADRHELGASVRGLRVCVRVGTSNEVASN